MQLKITPEQKESRRTVKNNKKVKND